MNITKNSTETITWDIECCEAEARIELSNGLMKVPRVEIYIKHDREFNCLITNSEQFIRDVHKALGQLIAHVDKERNVGSISEMDEIPWPGRLKMPEQLDNLIHERNKNGGHY